MKKHRGRKWTVNPVFLLFSAILLIMAGISYSYSLVIFFIELILSFMGILCVFISVISARSYKKNAIKSALKGLSGDDKRVFEEFKFPVAITGLEGDILWINSTFANDISPEHTPHGEFIENYLGSSNISKAFKKDGQNIRVRDNQFTVFAVKYSEIMIFYFINDTKQKLICERYKNTRPCVVSAVFDNIEEFERDVDDSVLGSVLIPLEALLIKWTASFNGTYKKVSGNKYIMLFEEAYFQKIVETKFSLLDSIREIKSPDGVSVTVSMGVGRGGESFRECDLWSRKALEMALGRGGDQVVIKNDNDYLFFGGVLQGTQRKDKVRSRVIALALIEKIKLADKVFIMGHNYSDLDCIGAGAGLFAVAKKGFKKDSRIIVKEEVSPAAPLISDLKELYDKEMFCQPAEALKNITDKSLLIIVDTHSPDFLESKEVYNKAKNIVVIDHHRMMVNHIDNASLFYQETFASSACEMVAELSGYMCDSAVTKHIAEALLAGIMLDTKNFTMKTGSRTFDASAYLCRKSADALAVRHLFASSLDEYKAKCELVNQAEQFANYAIATTSVFAKNMRITASRAADEMLNIKNVDASFVIFPIEGAINISARSLGKVNVQLIMESMGGGGHFTMAAVQIKDITAEQARQLLLEKLEEFSLKG